MVVGWKRGDEDGVLLRVVNKVNACHHSVHVWDVRLRCLFSITVRTVAG